MDHFGQLLTAAITPFDSNGVMETDTFWRLCKKLVGEGSDGIVLTGTTAESPNLTESDRLNIYSTAKDAVGDKSKLIAGTGTYSTKESIHFTKLAEEVGMDGIMIVTPYYNKPSQMGILKTFRILSKILLSFQSWPTTYQGEQEPLIELETIEKLIKDVGIHSIKDAVGNFDFSREELIRFKDDVFIYSGDDALTKNFIENGAVGVVSVASHLVGRQIKEMINLILVDKKTEAEKIHQLLLPFIEAIFEEPSPGPVKYLLSESWENVGKPLLPMTDVSPGIS